MICFPNAKINLGLHITERRPDGYHNIESVFYPIPFKDVLEIICIEGNKDQWVFYGLPIPGDVEGNLAYKALQLLRKDFEIPTLKICLQKEIAMGGGVGGGSADGAFMLRLLNDTFSLDISAQELKKYALELGSDCPFFIDNEPMFVQGRGEILSPFSSVLSGFYFVLLAPGLHISTKDAYAGIIPNNNRTSLKTILKSDVGTWKDNLHNDFEQTVFEKFPELAAIKEELYKCKASYVSLSGTGSCIYGLFTDKPQLTSFLKKMQVCEAVL